LRDYFDRKAQTLLYMGEKLVVVMQLVVLSRSYAGVSKLLVLLPVLLLFFLLPDGFRQATD
jgi:hypothetical protein